MVLDCFQEDEGEYKAKDLADKLNISVTTVARLLNTLVECGYLTKDEETNKYRLGLKAFTLGIYANPQPKLHQVARPYLEKISEQTNETVSLNYINPVTLTGIIIASIESKQYLKTSATVGVSRPLYLGASRKVLLAYTFPSQREVILQKAEAESDIDIAKLKKDLEEIRNRGFAYTEEEVNKGTLNVAAPILDENGNLLAGIAISSPTLRKKQDTIQKFSHIVRKAAKEIGEQMN
jgi:DNA-binding IclR family transcriptional regulator